MQNSPFIHSSSKSVNHSTSGAGHVILGRPHPLIVKAMRPFLSEQGYIPVRWNEQLAYGAKISGLVLSTAVSTDAKQSFNESFKTMLRKHPGIPMVVATIMPTDIASKMLCRAAEEARVSVSLQTLDEQAPAQLTRFQGSQVMRILMLQREDLITEARKKKASALVERHFSHLGQPLGRAA